MKIFYICSYGGSGSKMLTAYLNNFGKVYHIHSRNPPNKLEGIHGEYFNGNPIIQEELKNYCVIFIYKNPINSIYSKFFDSNHLRNVETASTTTLRHVINQKKDLYGIEEFFDNYVTKNIKRNYKVHCVKYEDFFDNISTFNKTFNLKDDKSLYPIKREREHKKSEYITLKNIYQNLLNKMDKMKFIHVENNEMNLVFDIGCNVGEFYSKCFEVYPDCHVVGVDANKNLIEGVTPRSNLTLLHSLVSSRRNENIDFYVDNYQTGISTASKEYINSSRFAKGSKYVRPQSGYWGSPIQVPSITLDELTEEYGSPDYIKIDVEGYEYEALRGLTKKQGMVSFEWHEEGLDILYNCVAHLQELGYDRFGITGYFDEGDIFEGLTYDSRGDSYLIEPQNYYSWEELEVFLNKAVNPTRRVNYGMLTAK